MILLQSLIHKVLSMFEKKMCDTPDPFLISLDQYSFKKSLREGVNGMSHVHIVKNGKRKIVLKFANLIHPMPVDRIIHEINVLKKCVYPSIVHFEGYCPACESHSWVFATSYIASTLEEVYDRGRKTVHGRSWCDTQSVNVVLGLAAGLRFLHSMNVPHGNLKPSNILIDKNNRPLISDFYFNYLSDNKNKYYPTNSKNDIKDDIYAFASIVFELFTQRSPFENKPHSRDDMPQDLSPLLSDIIFECWNEDIYRRPSFNDIFQRLAENLADIAKEADISVTRNYLSLLLAFDRERLMSMYGDTQCANNFGRFLIESSQSASFRVMGQFYVDSALNTPDFFSQSATVEEVETATQQQKQSDNENNAKSKINIKEELQDDLNSISQTEQQSAGTQVEESINSSQVILEKKSPDVLREKPKELTPDIFTATKKGDLESVRYLTLLEDFVPEAANSEGHTIAHIAAIEGHLEIIKYLQTLRNFDIFTRGEWGIHYFIIELPIILLLNMA